MDNLTMATTVDCDIHLFEGDVATIRMKVYGKKWLESVDGRFIRCDKVVSVWTPAEEEVEGWYKSGE